MTSISANTVIQALFLYAPQFATEDPDILNNYYALYNLISCQVNSKFLSCCGVSVFAFLMAHYLTIAQQPNAGVLNDIKEGDLSLGYNVAFNMTALELTPYGRMYLDLVRRTVVGSTVSNLPIILGGIPGPPIGCCNAGWGYGFGNAGCGC